MLNFAMIKPLGGLMKRLNVQGLMDELKTIDADFLKSHPLGSKPPEELTEEEKKELQKWRENKEAEMIKIGMILFQAVVTRLEDVADDLVTVCAAYKNVPVEEMMQQNPLEVFKEMIGEAGFIDFFSSAAQSATPK